MDTIKVKNTSMETICKFKLDVDNEEFKKHIYAKGAVDRTKPVEAFRTGYYLHQDPAFKEFGQSVLQYAHLFHDANDIIYDGEFYPCLRNMWGAVYNGDGVDYAKSHTHFPFFCVFCYYVETPVNCPPLVFPNTFGKYKIHPEQGDLIMFSGHIHHSVPKAVHDGERIVIAGNISMY